jgi:hypothetical protein
MLRRQTKGETAGLWPTLLLLGFAGAFRRSELLALDVADLEEAEDVFQDHHQHPPVNTLR